MIAYIKGEVKFKDEYLIVERQGIGYKVYVPTDLLAKKKEGDGVALYTHEYHRDDGADLYGFATPEQLRFFEDVTGVSGIGPKSGLAMLSQYRVEEIKKSIIHGDTSLLTKISGIGKKTADRLVLELKEKISVGREEGVPLEGAAGEDEALAALSSLGYSRAEALAALDKADPGLPVEEKVRLALRSMSEK